MRLLTGDLAQDKVVVFSFYKQNLRVLSQRLTRHRIGHEYIWGEEADKAKRFAIQQQFHKDPKLQVILGTTALEMSLNLQCARFLIFYDSLYNPSRNLQIVGRIRRLGSVHGTCIAVTMLTRDTLEEGMWEVLSKRAAVSDFVFNEGTGAEMFERLTDDELYLLIRGGA